MTGSGVAASAAPASGGSGEPGQSVGAVGARAARAGSKRKPSALSFPSSDDEDDDLEPAEEGIDSAGLAGKRTALCGLQHLMGALPASHRGSSMRKPAVWNEHMIWTLKGML
jgi:hypothetical protein